MKAEIVVVAYRSAAALEELLATLPAEWPVTIADNSADEEPLDAILASRPGVRHLPMERNVGFAGAANAGARAAGEEIVVFVNPDARPTREQLGELLGQLEADPGCAACGPRWVDERGANQLGAAGFEPSLSRALVHALGLYRLWPRAGLWALPRAGQVFNVDWLAGACLAVRRRDFLAVGGFDESYFLYQEDAALGKRLRAVGWSLLLRGDLALLHVRGASSDVHPRRIYELRARSLARYLEQECGALRARRLGRVLAAGYRMRGWVHRGAGNGRRADEMQCYAEIIGRAGQ